MVALQKHLEHQLQWRQGLTYHDVSRRISANPAAVHGMLTMNPKYREVSSFRENPANVSVYCQGRVT